MNCKTSIALEKKNQKSTTSWKRDNAVLTVNIFLKVALCNANLKFQNSEPQNQKINHSANNTYFENLTTNYIHTWFADELPARLARVCNLSETWLCHLDIFSRYDCTFCKTLFTAKHPKLKKGKRLTEKLKQNTH